MHEGVDATTHLVRDGEDSAWRGVLRVTDHLPPVAGAARVLDGVRRVSTDGVLGSVRVVNRAVELLVGAGLARVPDAPVAPIPMRSDVTRTAAWAEDAALGVVNGLVGDQLRGGSAALDLGLRLRHGDAYLPDTPPPRPDRPDVVVLVHGLTATEWCWSLDAERYHGDATATFGTLLQRDLGLEPVYVRFNTGRPVADNGERLAARLDALCAAWNPGRIVLLGHSMGGLVALAACRVAQREGQAWLARVSDVVSLATPHRGAPTARLADLTARALAAVDVPATQVLAGILDARSGGIRDLHAREPEAGAEDTLLPGIRYAFFSATFTADSTVARLAGDLLVPVASASGPRGARVPIHARTFGGVLHHQIQCHPEVYAAVRAALTPATPPATPPAPPATTP